MNIYIYITITIKQYKTSISIDSAQHISFPEPFVSFIPLKPAPEPSGLKQLLLQLFSGW